MRSFPIFALAAGHLAFGASSPPIASATSEALHEPAHDDSHIGVLPILDIGTGYILGQSQNNVSTGLHSDDDPDPGPVQCGPDKECLDKSCCNSDGKCGFQEVHCHPKEPKKCLSNCDAKAMCGVDSKDGKQKCGLNLCCSYYGWCGTNATHCGDTDEKGFKTPCQKDFGKCEIVPSPSCGKDSGSATNGRRIAYYQSWNTRQRMCNRIWPDRINTTGLTHLNFAFASIDPKTFRIRPMHPDDLDLYRQFTALKSASLQTWIAVGGWDFSDPGPTRETWSKMASKEENRKTFVESTVQFLKDYGFQGLDLDWEYPVTSDRGGHDEDTGNQIKLVEDLRKAFGKDFGLSSILAPDYWYLRHMDPKAMEPHMDWFNFMGYDLHGAWDADTPTVGNKIRPHTDLRDIEKDLIPLWFNGLDSKKVNLGIAYYGRGYTASDKSCLQYGCDFKGPSAAGHCTSFPGFLSKYEIQKIIKDKDLKPELMKDAAVKQVTWEDQWIGYDDDETRDLKLSHANERCLGGSFIWSIDFGSGSGTGDDPDLPGTSPNSTDVVTDVYVPTGIWWQETPTVQCVPPCTLVIPPYTLDQMTTITWPAVTTSLISFEGGTTSTVTTTYETVVGGTITKETVVYLTVGGGIQKTITTTISVPPFTTNKIEFWPVSIEKSDARGNVSFAPQPRVRPPPVEITMSPGQNTFLPSPYPHTFTPTATESASDDLPTVFPTGTYTLPYYPQPTIGIALPSNPRPSCTVDWCEPPPPPAPSCNFFWCSTPSASSSIASPSYRWPSTIVFEPDPPLSTCTQGCGDKFCQVFGCPPSDTDKDKGGKGGGGGGGGGGGCHPTFPNIGCGCGPLGLPAPCSIGGLGGIGGGGRCYVPFGCDPSGGTIGGGGEGGSCGFNACDGGCGLHGCGGGCGTQGCGGNCVGGTCNPCPLEKCGGEGCKSQQCGPNPPAGSCKDGPCPPNPTGGDPNRPKCDEDKKTTVTDYWVSCTKFNPTSSSCTTTRSITLSGCGLTPTTTTTQKGPQCTKASLSLDDDMGDDEGEPVLETSSTQASQKPTPTSDPLKCENGCGCCNNYYQNCLRGCKDAQSKDCINKCVSDMCWANDSPAECHYGKGCASEFCPKSPQNCDNGCGCCNDHYQSCLRGCKDQQSRECIDGCVSNLCSGKESPEICHTDQKCGKQIDLCPQPKKPITKSWRLRIHQEMEFERSSIWWTLIDSNGEEAGKGQGSPINSNREDKDRSLQHQVIMEARDPTNKDRTNIEFTLDAEINKCKPRWSTGQTGPKGKRPGVRECSDDLVNKYRCDLPEEIEWKGKNAGFERYFECWFQDI